MKIDRPSFLTISGVMQENPHVRTFWFDHTLGSSAGQFILLWIPGVDQKPFSISYDDGNRFGITIFAVGPLSKKLYGLQVGDRVGITGPYGNGFSIKENTHYIAVAGGYGAGPLGMLAEKLKGTGSTIDFCVGARSHDLLLFEDRIAQLPYARVHVATDDGSKGHKGYVTEVVDTLLHSCENISRMMLVACGPELMERAVLQRANQYHVACEISIERYMKCGFGVCGQCCVDASGLRMCVEGPVVDRNAANTITEFGIYHRGRSGAKKTF